MTDWTCPRCGGWAFGTLLGRDGEPDIRRCDSDEHGVCLSMTHEEFEALEHGGPYPKRGKPCGWKGVYE
jgi:hypothetical protein